ncbi:MAG: CRISPR-associated endonuclease Cas2 [Candidatus Aenigmatarchaeota archaeon]
MFVILVYDVKEDRVVKVLKICRRYLTRVQNSVFEGETTEAKLLKLINELKNVIDLNYDSVVIYKFRTKQYYQRQSIGIERPSHEDLII